MLTYQRVTGAALLGLAAAVLLVPGLARADVGVTNLRMGRDYSADPSTSRFAPGINSVWARFDYLEASNHQIGLTVMVHGGLVGYGTALPLAGSGSESVEITGDAVLRSVSAEAADSAKAARSNADKAATQTYGTVEYLIQVEAGLNRVDSALIVVHGIESSQIDEEILAAMEVASDETRTLLDRAANASDDQRRKELAAAMERPLGDLVSASEQLSTAAGEAHDVPLSVSGDVWQYVVRISVDGTPALTTEFDIAGSTIYAPYISK